MRDAVGPYRLIRRIGSGGMGEVFLAYDSRLDREVAIKHAHPERADDDQRSRFRREAFMAAKLAHPAIIPIFDIVSEPDGDWIVMEYVDGPTLRDYLRVHGRPRLGAALSWAEQIARGLAAAHAKGIVHRDLKAENVMLTASDHLKIVDFGLAKPFEGDDPKFAVSASGAVLGTLKSMAPEQARGHRIDHRADLFSLGVLLYELVAGTVPFGGSSPLEILTRLATEPHEPLNTWEPGLPAALSALVDRLLAKSPEARPGSATEVADQLLSIRQGLAAPAGEHAAPAVALLETTYLQELPAAGKAKIAETVTGTPAGTPVTGALPESPAEAPPSPRRTSSFRTWPVLVLLVVVVLAGSFFWLRRQPASTETAAAATVPADVESLRLAGNEKLQRWYRKGQLTEAIDLFQRALLLEKDSAPVLAGLSRAYWLESKFAGRDELPLKQARAVAEQAIRLDPYLASAQVALGFAAADLGDLPAAEAAFARAEMLEPGPLMAYGRGYLANARGDSQAAEAAYRESLERGASSEVENALGSLLFRQKRHAEARLSFERAIELAPDGVFGHRNLAGVYFAEGNLQAATSQLQRALEIENNSSLYSTLGTILFYQGLYAEAKNAFELAIERAGQEGKSGSSAFLWANLGDSYRFLPEHEEKARIAFRRAAQLSEPEARAQPNNADVRSRFALYLAKAGDAPAAQRELAAVRALNQLEGSVPLRLILAYEALGDRAVALDLLSQAFATGLTPTDIEAEPELTRLRSDPGYHRLVAALH